MSMSYASPVTEAPDSTLAGRLLGLRQAVDHAHSLAGGAEGLADRLLGSRPEKNECGFPSALVPNGLYEEFGNVIENLQAALLRIEAALGRAVAAIG
jgi:hypothetical protein